MTAAPAPHLSRWVRVGDSADGRSWRLDCDSCGLGFVGVAPTDSTAQAIAHRLHEEHARRLEALLAGEGDE